MKRLLLLLVPVFFLLAACALPTYKWQHEAGLGEMDLQKDWKFCSRYAEGLTPPVFYNPYPYFYFRHSFEHDDFRRSYRHYPRFYAYRWDYIDPYAYRMDLIRACMKGKGWSRIRVTED